MNAYSCPTGDFYCPYFCHSKNEYGFCLMSQEGSSPVTECEAFDGIDPEDYVV